MRPAYDGAARRSPSGRAWCRAINCRRRHFDGSLSDRGGIMTIVDKMTAAERLMQNAVDMIDRKDDPLAIHVVASSALSLLRELVGTRGDAYVAQLIKEALFRAAPLTIQGLPPGRTESVRKRVR